MTDETEKKNALTAFGGALGGMLDVSAVEQALAEEEAEVQPMRRYANFSGKSGRYTFGTKDDGREPEEGELFLINPASWTKGYICWRGGRPVAKRSTAFFGGEDLSEWYAAAQDEYTGAGTSWNRSRGWVMRSLTTDDENEYEMTLTATSAVKEASEVIKAFGNRVRSGQPFFPVIECGKVQFPGKDEHGNQQINWKPTFNIVGWLNQDQVEDLAANEVTIDDLLDAEYPDELPAPTPARRAPPAKPAPSTAPAPRRRRAKSS